MAALREMHGSSRKRDLTVIDEGSRVGIARAEACQQRRNQMAVIRPATQDERDLPEGAEPSIIPVRIMKALSKGEKDIRWGEVVLEKVPTEFYMIALQVGLEKILSCSPMSKVEKGDEESAKEAFEANLALLYEGKLRRPVGFATKRLKGRKPAKSDTEKKYAAEEKRQAKLMIKDMIRARGEKVTDYATKDINAAAEGLLEDEVHGQTIREKAKQVVDAAMKDRADLSEQLGLEKITIAIPTDPEKVAKRKQREKEKAAKLAAAPAKRGRGRPSARA